MADFSATGFITYDSSLILLPGLPPNESTISTPHTTAGHPYLSSLGRHSLAASMVMRSSPMGTSGGVLGIPTLPLPVNREVATRDGRSSAAAVLTGSSSHRSDDGGGGDGPSMSHASDITSPGG